MVYTVWDHQQDNLGPEDLRDLEDSRNKTERLLNAATDHIEDTHEQPTDPRAWDHLLAYCPASVLFNRLVSKIDFDGMDARTFSLAELQGAIEGAELPK